MPWNRFSKWLRSRRLDPVPQAIPVLCYHSWSVNGCDYSNNDHVALAQDLRMLARNGYCVLPVESLVAWHRGELDPAQLAGLKPVCLSFDDGRDHDYLPADYDAHGQVPGVHALLRESQVWLPQCLPGTRAVSFVIASPEARSILDREVAKRMGPKSFYHGEH